MNKLRTLGVGLAVAAGIALFGAGTATAEETGSAESVTTILEALTSGSAGATDPTDPGTGGGTTDPGTGGGTTPTSKKSAIADEAETGSSDTLAAILEALSSGSGGGATDPTDPGTGGGTTDPGTGTGGGE
ncbi:hypothetical protein [Nocardia asteroides]|uniref:hypothetical protein n=1 Tax=Nocardia asteroides TaxID=1824 RepID=UPI00365D89D5